MRRTLALAAAAALGLAAQQPDDAPGLVRRALAAHGGTELINKFPAAKIKVKGCMAVPGYPHPAEFTSLVTYQMPDRFKQVLNINLAGIPQSVTQLVDGEKVRQFVGGQEVPMTEADAGRFRQAMYVQNLMRLVPLADARAYRLALAEDATVCERPARGLRVSADRRREVTLFFDKGTNLLVRSVRQVSDLQGKDALMEEIFTNYKDARGVLYPSKSLILTNGKKTIESEVVEFLPLERFDAAEFAGP